MNSTLCMIIELWSILCNNYIIFEMDSIPCRMSFYAIPCSIQYSFLFFSLFFSLFSFSLLSFFPPQKQQYPQPRNKFGSFIFETTAFVQTPVHIWNLSSFIKTFPASSCHTTVVSACHLYPWVVFDNIILHFTCHRLIPSTSISLLLPFPSQ